MDLYLEFLLRGKKNSYLPFKKEAIGKKLSLSGEHAVYCYGKNSVIKFPAGPIHQKSPAEAMAKAKKEFGLVKQYLKDFLPPSELLLYGEKNQSSYCIKQKFIKGKPLNFDDTKKKSIKDQLKTLVQKNQQMFQKTGFTLEFFGLRGIFLHAFFKSMENLLVTEKEKILIIDFGLITEKEKITSFPLANLVMQLVILRQNHLLKKYIA